MKTQIPVNNDDSSLPPSDSKPEATELAERTGTLPASARNPDFCICGSALDARAYECPCCGRQYPEEMEVELLECEESHDCGWGDWSCRVTMPDGTILEQCEVFSDGDEWEPSTLRDMSGPTPRNL